MTDNYYLTVYENRSELTNYQGEVEIFLEGPTSADSQRRYQKIQMAFEEGFLIERVEHAMKADSLKDATSKLLSPHQTLIEELVNQVTSGKGRALAAISIMQLCIRIIEPKQSVRLHKGSNSISSFSWREGISMRSLDSSYVTPVLREYNLVKLNKDGFMMTRTLAENYPYSRVYKAQLQGARDQWLELVELIENDKISADAALTYILALLVNRAEAFQALADNMLEKLDQTLERLPQNSFSWVLNIIIRHIDDSSYAARLMEVAMHSLVQAIDDSMALSGRQLKPLSQMRSANKKHGNIGDIELLLGKDIVEAWDAKYGKGYLRDEIEELADKIPSHEQLAIAGFVTSVPPIRLDEMKDRIDEISQMSGTQIEVLEFEDWVKQQFEAVTKIELVSEEQLAKRWIVAYAESLAQKRRDIAPIDEPCHHWVEALLQKLNLL